MKAVLRLRSDPSGADETARALDEAGVPVIAATTVPDAVTALAQGEVGLVLVDCPGDDGAAAELIKTLRGAPHGSEVPLLVLRGRATDVVLEKALHQAGASAILVPPDPASVMAAAVRALLASQTPALPIAAGQRDLEARWLLTLAHELRNPLAAIHGALLAARLAPPRAAPALEIAVRQAEQLGRVLDDLFALAGVAGVPPTLARQRTDLRVLAERAITAFRRLPEWRSRAVTASFPETALPTVADPTRLEQAVLNLLRTAARLTGPGDRIEVVATRAGDAVTLGVRPTSASSTPPRWSGRSLDTALLVSQRLVALHGGTIEVRSDPASLAPLFLLRLPSEAEHLAGQAPEEVGRTCARVLVVEDDRDTAESLRMLLEVIGHDVHVAHDGSAALAMATAHRPDVILLDIGLPDMSGYQLVRQLREMPGGPELRIVALTGYGSEEHRRRAFEAGIDVHLVKPVELAVLRALLPPSA